MTLVSPEELEATFVPGAGMVGCSLRDRGEELLGQRGGLAAWREKSSTFGIPLLYPWANRLGASRYEAAGRSVEIGPDAPLVHRDGNGLPIHGLLFAAPDWGVVQAGPQPGGAGLLARLDWGADPRRLGLFPFPHALEISVRLAGLRLEVATTVLAGEAGPVPVAFGWHPYLAPPGAPRSDWEVYFPPVLRLEADDLQLPTGAREKSPVAAGPLGDRTFDDGYAGVEPGTACSVSDGVRRITVEMTGGYPFAQLYAPGDLDVICFEPMTAPTNALASGDGLQVVEPGESFTATFTIAVERP
ncbi:MAG: aldose 1-epimerase [Solirubrobacterales bacterium]